MRDVAKSKRYMRFAGIRGYSGTSVGTEPSFDRQMVQDRSLASVQKDVLTRLTHRKYSKLPGYLPSINVMQAYAERYLMGSSLDRLREGSGS